VSQLVVKTINNETIKEVANTTNSESAISAVQSNTEAQEQIDAQSFYDAQQPNVPQQNTVAQKQLDAQPNTVPKTISNKKSSPQQTNVPATSENPKIKLNDSNTDGRFVQKGLEGMPEYTDFLYNNNRPDAIYFEQNGKYYIAPDYQTEPSDEEDIYEITDPERINEIKTFKPNQTTGKKALDGNSHQYQRDMFGNWKYADLGNEDYPVTHPRTLESLEKNYGKNIDFYTLENNKGYYYRMADDYSFIKFKGDPKDHTYDKVPVKKITPEDQGYSNLYNNSKYSGDLDFGESAFKNRVEDWRNSSFLERMINTNPEEEFTRKLMVTGLDGKGLEKYLLPSGKVSYLAKAIIPTILKNSRELLKSGKVADKIIKIVQPTSKSLDSGSKMLNSGNRMLNSSSKMLKEGAKKLNPPPGHQYKMPFQEGGSYNDLDNDMDEYNSKDTTDPYFKGGGFNYNPFMYNRMIPGMPQYTGYGERVQRGPYDKNTGINQFVSHNPNNQFNRVDVTKSGIFGRPKEYSITYNNNPTGKPEDRKLAGLPPKEVANTNVPKVNSYGQQEGRQRPWFAGKKYEQDFEDTPFSYLKSYEKPKYVDVANNNNNMIPFSKKVDNNSWDNINRITGKNSYGGLHKFLPQAQVAGETPIVADEKMKVISPQQAGQQLYDQSKQNVRDQSNFEPDEYTIDYKRKNMFSGNAGEALPFVNAGITGISNIIDNASNQKYNNSNLYNSLESDNLYGMDSTRDRGKYDDASSGLLKTDQTGSNRSVQFGGSMEDDDIVDMTEEELEDFLNAGGEVEYI